MKTFLGFVHNCTKFEPKEAHSHLALLGKEEEEEEEKQSSKELPPPFTPFSALELLPSSSLKHIGLQSVHTLQ